MRGGRDKAYVYRRRGGREEDGEEEGGDGGRGLLRSGSWWAGAF